MCSGLLAHRQGLYAELGKNTKKLTGYLKTARRRAIQDHPGRHDLRLQRQARLYRSGQTAATRRARRFAWRTHANQQVPNPSSPPPRVHRDLFTFPGSTRKRTRRTNCASSKSTTEREIHEIVARKVLFDLSNELPPGGEELRQHVKEETAAGVTRILGPISI